MGDDTVFVEGLPLEAKTKFIVMLSAMFALIVNHNLPIFSSMFDYPYRDFLSVGLLLVFVIFSIGHVVTETVVIGLAVFAIMSNIWDFSVLDVSKLRKGVLLGSFGVLFIALMFGKISFWNLGSILKRQLGAQ
ncbi:hypothetical protein CMI37_09390 [Candidatus Pacearchaeota archaeon]|nr:hypothetical protein [Candidatus Pacearchaeota archaeon]